MRPALVLALAMLLAGCGGSSSTNSTSATISNSESFSTFASAHFNFRYTSLDASSIATTAARVEAEYSRILADLDSDSSMPTVIVTLYADHRSLELGAQPNTVPSWASGLVTSSTQIHLMSPNLPQWGTYDRMVANVVHEFAHCVSLHINGNIANNPRWLWEAVAIYESGQFVDPRTLAYMTSHNPPSLAALSDLNDSRTYEVGYLLVEYIHDVYGQTALHRLIVANGDTASTLGVPLPQFEQEWFAWVRGKYGI